MDYFSDPTPSKKLGQNFLRDRKAVEKVLKAAELGKKDNVLEIGPGLGALTRDLALRSAKVIAVEKDGRMVKALEERLGGFKNLEIIQGDILKTGLDLPRGYKVVANLPFYVATHIIRRFLEDVKIKPCVLVLTVQREVGERICAKPGDMSILAVSVQFYAKAEIAGYISKKAFSPKPKVDSAIIRITPKKEKEKVDVDLFFKIVKAGFSQPRKQLANNLSKKLGVKRALVEKWLLENGVKPIQRAETLSVGEWINLANSFKIE